MKKIFTILLATLLFLNFTITQAQESPVAKGKWVTSGLTSLTFYSQKTTYDFKNGGDKAIQAAEGQTHTKIALMPIWGYFVITNLMIGAVMPIIWGKTVYPNDTGKSASGDNQNTNLTFAIGPVARYYYPLNEKFMPFGQAALYFGTTNNKNKWPGQPDNVTKQSLIGGGIGAGCSYFAADFLSVDGQLGYIYANQKEKLDGGAKNITKTGTFGIHFGFTFYLGNAKE